MGVDSTTYLADAKMIYGAIQEQVSTLPAVMNLFGDGSKFGKPVNNIGIRGYTFLARLVPNFNMGYRLEGTTGVGTAGNQGLAQATVSLKYAYVPVTITGQAENLTKGESRAFMQAKALETKFDMKDIVSHVNVVVAGGDRGGQLASVAAAPAPGAGTFYAANTGGFPGAIYIRVGMGLDSNAVGGGALTLNNSAVTAVNYSTRLVTHTTGTAVAAEAVYLAGEASATTGNFPVTAECLISLVSDSVTVQGLNPATAGQTNWKSWVKDAASADISAASMQELCQFVKNRGGEEVDLMLFPSAQVNSMVSIATQLFRFETNPREGSIGQKALDLGYNTFTFGGRTIVEDKDLRPDRIYAGASSMMKKFEAVPLSLAEDEAGTWTRIIGASGVADAVAGLLRWYHQIGIVQRSAWGVLKSLSVPISFLENAPTL